MAQTPDTITVNVETEPEVDSADSRAEGESIHSMTSYSAGNEMGRPSITHSRSTIILYAAISSQPIGTSEYQPSCRCRTILQPNSFKATIVIFIISATVPCTSWFNPSFSTW